MWRLGANSRIVDRMNTSRKYLQVSGGEERARLQIRNMYKVLDKFDYRAGHRLRKILNEEDLLRSLEQSVEEVYSCRELEDLIRVYENNPELLRANELTEELFHRSFEKIRKVTSDAIRTSQYMIGANQCEMVH